MDLSDQIMSYKKLNQKKIEKVLIHVLQTNHPSKIEIIEHFKNKFKFRPHTKLDNKSSFTEYVLRYGHYDLMEKYIPNIEHTAPQYNIINLCTSFNNIDLLKKYIVKKNINKNQFVNGETPVICAIKNQHIECLEILIQNGAYIAEFEDDKTTPLGCLVDTLIAHDKNGMITDESAQKFTRIIELLLPIHFNESEDVCEDLIEFTKIRHVQTYNDMVSNGLTSSPLQDIKWEARMNSKNVTDVIYNIRIDVSNVGKLLENSSNGSLEKYIIKMIERRPNILCTQTENFSFFDICCGLKCNSVVSYVMKNHYDIVLCYPQFINTLFCDGYHNIGFELMTRYPKLSESYIYDDDNRTIIENVVMTSKIDNDEKISIINRLIDEFQIYPSNKNRYGTTAIELSIQYATANVFQCLIKHVISPIILIRLLHVSIQYDKLDNVKLITETKLFDIISKYARDFLISAIKLNKPEIVSYMLRCNKFKISSEDLRDMYELATKNLCSDVILNMLNKDHKIVNNSLGVAQLNGLINIYFKTFNKDKESILVLLKTIILIVLKITLDPMDKLVRKNYFEKEENIIEYIKHNDRMNKSSLYGDSTLLICAHIGFVRMNPISLESAIDLVFERTRREYNITKIRQLLMIDENDKLKKMSNDIDFMFNHYIVNGNNVDSDSDDEKSEEEKNRNDDSPKSKQKGKKKTSTIVKQIDYGSDDVIMPHEYSDDEPECDLLELAYYKNKNVPHQQTTYHIKTYNNMILENLVSKLEYPFVLTNYTTIKKFVCDDMKLKIQEYGDRFDIMKNDVVIAVLQKNNKKSIDKYNIPMPKWFDYYGYNICTDNKVDDDHTFPFVIDMLLMDLFNKKDKNIKCSYMAISKQEATFMFFKGSVLRNGEMVLGHFEYFVNKKNMLFHRLFKKNRDYVY